MRDFKTENEALSKDSIFGSFYIQAKEQGKTLLEKNPILKRVDGHKLLYCLTKYNKQTLNSIRSVIGSNMPLSDDQKLNFISNALNMIISREGKLVEVFCISKGNEIPSTNKKTQQQRLAQKMILVYAGKLKQVTLWDGNIRGYGMMTPGKGYKATFNEGKGELYPVESPLISPIEMKMENKDIVNMIPSSFPPLKPPFSTAVKNALYYITGIVFKGAGPFYTLDTGERDGDGNPLTLSVMNMPDGLSGQLVLVVGNIVPSTYEEGSYTMFSSLTLPLSDMVPNGNSDNANGSSKAPPTFEGNAVNGDDNTFNEDFNID